MNWRTILAMQSGAVNREKHGRSLNNMLHEQQERSRLLVRRLPALNFHFHYFFVTCKTSASWPT
jgi:hypothetical protein